MKTWLVLLIIIVGGATTASGEPHQLQSSALAACKKVADRYRPLAEAHPGESPLGVLAKTRASRITTYRPKATMFDSTAELKDWGAKQTPPVVMDDVIKEVEESLDQPGGVLEQIPNTNYYSITESVGEAQCVSSVYFTITNGRAKTAPSPPGFADGCLHYAQRIYGSVDGVPAYFQEAYPSDKWWSSKAPT